jgi:hypothetical protein
MLFRKDFENRFTSFLSIMSAINWFFVDNSSTHVWLPVEYFHFPICNLRTNHKMSHGNDVLRFDFVCFLLRNQKIAKKLNVNIIIILNTRREKLILLDPRSSQSTRLNHHLIEGITITTTKNHHLIALTHSFSNL